MEPFLKQVARRLVDEHPEGLRDITVIFNNHRAGLFLKRQLEQLCQPTAILPRIVGIDELVGEMGGLEIVQHEFLLFELYDIYRQTSNSQKFNTFEDFISLGEVMLADFSEVDLYLVDARNLFHNIRDEKRLGQWHLDSSPLSDLQLNYLAFFESLYDYYLQLNERLLHEGRAYTGMAYRNVAEHIDSMADEYLHRLQPTPSPTPKATLYFVGFNALSECERTIINAFVRRGVGALICDGDSYYVDDLQQEAGLFLRKIGSQFPESKHFDSHFSEGERHITIVNCPEKVLQAKAAGQIIAQLIESKNSKDNKKEREDDEKAPEEIAVVLNEENMLLPMLNSLPEQVGKANVTMGYPYALSNTHRLIAKLLALYTRSSRDRFHHSEVVDVLADGMLSKLLETRNLRALLSDRIEKDKLIFLAPEEVAALTSGIGGADSLAFLFDNAQPSPDEVLAKFRQLAQLLVNSGVKKEAKEREAIACLLQIINHFETLQGQYHFVENVSTLQKIYQRLASRRKIAFFGEPLSGLQCLGMLETRSLDFENLVMLSVNEGVLPAGRSGNSLIPFNLKSAFHIPTFEEKDAVFAYHFYRLLQRAKNVYLLYSSDSSEMGKGEASRFILQVKNELAERFPNIHLHEQVVSATMAGDKPAATARFAKDSRTRKALQEMANNGLAPTALNTYRDCPMKFYYQQVLGIREAREASDDIEKNELGEFIHNQLRDIYHTDSDGIIKAKTLKAALQDLDATINRTFANSLLRGRNCEGRNHLNKEIAKLQISRLLEKEIRQLEAGHSIAIEQLEEMAEKEPLTLTDGTLAHIKGQPDRIDRYDGQLRVIDYKSGKVDPSDLVFNGTKDEELPDWRAVSNKWFQVMTYAWIHCHHNNCQEPFLTGIYPLQAIASEFLPAEWNGTSILENKAIGEFEAMLGKLVGELLNPEQEFYADPKEGACLYCPMRLSCPAAKTTPTQ